MIEPTLGIRCAVRHLALRKPFQLGAGWLVALFARLGMCFACFGSTRCSGLLGQVLVLFCLSDAVLCLSLDTREHNLVMRMMDDVLFRGIPLGAFSLELVFFGSPTVYAPRCIGKAVGEQHSTLRPKRFQCFRPQPARESSTNSSRVETHVVNLARTGCLDEAGQAHCVQRRVHFTRHFVFRTET